MLMLVVSGGKDALSFLQRFLVTESLLQMMSNAFNVTLKTLSVLKICKFLVMYKNDLIRNVRLISKFVT